ncbi:MAG: hypothetical protein OEX07_14640 [Gammaproteobacteria bacterium]|nr:hypothetical protein [Gammaproteobacteria bacterium]
MDKIEKIKKLVRLLQQNHNDPELEDDYLDPRTQRILSVSVMQFARDMELITTQEYCEVLAHFYPNP